MTQTHTKQLSPDQQIVLDAVLAWYRKSESPLLTLGGYAGTGKTTLIAALTAILREKDHVRIAFSCFTGKAASILKSKLERVDALGADYCGTIHGLIYDPVMDDHGHVQRWERRPVLPADLIILDEASMVDEMLFKDLESYGVPTLAVGDHGQLPPINGTFNLMANPQLRLEKIHRQAQDNPIIRASMMVRETGRLPLCNWDGKVIKVMTREILDSLDLKNTLLICGTNRTRVSLNAYVRGKLGYTKRDPQPGEKVICLRNNRRAGIFNGMTGVIDTIRSLGQHHYRADIDLDGLQYHGTINRPQFGSLITLKGTEIQGLDRREYGDLFDWGWAMTCHKSQGSEADQVVVFEECGWMEDKDLQRRWLYTAYTRAAERLIVIGR